MSLLFPDPVAPAVPGIDLRCCDVAEVLSEVRGAALVHADPPWTYDSTPPSYNTEYASEGGVPQYTTLPLPEIAASVDAAYDCSGSYARLVLWCTFPKLIEWVHASAGMRWRYVTGGAWGKTAGKFGSAGIGFHWCGRSEIVLVYGKGSPPRDASVHLSNHHVAPTTTHSEKPHEWLATMLRKWTAPGDLVLDLYAGLAPMARACLATGRRYVGAEIDPTRHAAAMAKLWRGR